MATDSVEIKWQLIRDNFDLYEETEVGLMTHIAIRKALQDKGMHIRVIREAYMNDEGHIRSDGQHLFAHWVCTVDYPDDGHPEQTVHDMVYDVQNRIDIVDSGSVSPHLWDRRART
jgi:hypothetical protein